MRKSVARKQSAVDGMNIRLDAGCDDIGGDTLAQVFLLSVGDPYTNLAQSIGSAGECLDGIVHQLELLAYQS